MKDIKVQQDILARAGAGKIMIGTIDNNKIVISLDGYSAYLINKDNFFLDAEKFGTFDFKKIFNAVSEARIINPTGVTITKDKNKLIEFKNDISTVYCNEKYFKYFDSKNIEYQYCNGKLFVYENYVMRGLVMEVRGVK